ncbi:MAG: hypothetical protein ABJC51_06525 [Acidobacteriota bacterium]
MDAVLESFRRAPDDQADERLGALLAGEASPIIRRVIASRLGGAAGEADDVHAQVLMQLMLRLRDGRVEDGLASIDAFGAYVATAAHHGCDHYLRRKYPQRWRLRNRIRYVLEHDRRFAIWKSPQGAWRCGVRGEDALPAGKPPAAAAVGRVEPAQLKALLTRIFALSAGPLDLSVVVDLTAAVWAVPLFQHEDPSGLNVLADQSRPADDVIAQRQRTARTWEEITRLPVRQRQALLLNLKDDALGLFLVTGTASLAAMAETLEMGVAVLAALWHALPLPDTELAARLGCTRQQVINLRMAARKRLLNRLVSRTNIRPVRSSS